MCKCAQAVHSKYDNLGYSLGKLSSFPKQFPSGTQAVFKLVHHLDMYVHKRVSKLRTAYFSAVFVIIRPQLIKVWMRVNTVFRAIVFRNIKCECLSSDHIICDRIWENPPYGIRARFAQCAFLVAQV